MPEYLEKSKVVYKSARFGIRTQDVMLDTGKVFHMEYMDHPGAAAILPFLDDDTIVMIRNERYVVSENLWELPAGTLERGEPPLETAKRELIEETGYSASEVKEFMRFYTSPGICNELMYAYVARDLKLEEQNLDDSETISVHPLPMKKVLEMVRDGEITDGKTVTMLLFYQQFHDALR